MINSKTLEKVRGSSVVTNHTLVSFFKKIGTTDCFHTNGNVSLVALRFEMLMIKDASPSALTGLEGLRLLQPL
jgi:hypothetical protein